ncbi:MAG: hypothetical protein IPF92_02320 [Myxococcales bacterium]|nr:hypothetical protein [Myxococcales bacterium]MBL0193963.1 hypothetical protein [Myxococcales bacterium]
MQSRSRSSSATSASPAAVAALALALAGCSAGTGDVPAKKEIGPPVGDGNRIREIADPGIATRPAPGSDVTVTGVTVVAVDTFDETKNGKSRGAIFVQDLGSKEPYSGIGIFAPAFVPGDLRVAAGDVLDLRGEYQENKNIGTAIFPEGQVLPQLSRPVATFRYDFRPPEPREIDVKDLNDYAIGRRWIGMLVTVKNVAVDGRITDNGGRVTGFLLPKGSGADDRNRPTVTNELYDLKPADAENNQGYASITGVVTYFFNLHIAPRSAADLVKR